MALLTTLLIISIPVIVIFIFKEANRPVYVRSDDIED